ncbi:hypothetical protein [Nocardiopsis alba]|uniref:hypothetical protein n=1 Tax=Nocardiopsis alba TaxID=53437 RepID=UPI003D736C75
MSEGIRWIGEHGDRSPKAAAPGMLGGISLTAARGIDAEDLLLCLGADPFQLDEGHLYRERASVPLPESVNPHRVGHAMYGTCGDWAYVLEDGAMATWYSVCFMRFSPAPPMPELAGVETVCTTLNRYDRPSRLAHATPEGDFLATEYGGDTGLGSELDAALRAAGAVFPSMADTPEAEVGTYWAEHGEELPPAVLSAVGEYCGLRIDRAEVEAGDLPLALLFPWS